MQRGNIPAVEKRYIGKRCALYYFFFGTSLLFLPNYLSWAIFRVALILLSLLFLSPGAIPALRAAPVHKSPKYILYSGTCLARSEKIARVPFQFLPSEALPVSLCVCIPPLTPPSSISILLPSCIMSTAFERSTPSVNTAQASTKRRERSSRSSRK